jgi:tetratricopeptide (TPR) repeat protein
MKSERLKILLQWLDEKPNDSFLIFALAQEYHKREDYEAAIKTYRKLETKDPDYVGLYYHLAYCHVLLENNTEALEVYNAGIEIARKLNDHHALSELQNAKTNLEMEML